MALKKRLQSDASLRRILAQYVPLELDTKAEDWQTWARQFKHEGESIPIIYVVRADGKLLYGKGGTMEGPELPKFLALMRQQTGLALTPRQVTTLSESLEKGAKAHEQGDTATAVLSIAKLPKGTSYAAVMVQAQEFAAKLVEEANADLKKADEQLGSSELQLEGALTLARVQRDFRPLPEIAKAARLLRAKHLKDQRDVLTQAEQLDAAKKLEEDKALVKALRAYQLVVERHAGSAAAKLAEADIKRLEEAGVKVASSPADKTKPNTTSDADLRKAKSYLRFARTLATKRPEKAKEYLRKVIALVPGSPEAEQAERLLKQIR